MSKKGVGSYTTHEGQVQDKRIFARGDSVVEGMEF
jgi:hypothetical protein